MREKMSPPSQDRGIGRIDEKKGTLLPYTLHRHRATTEWRCEAGTKAYSVAEAMKCSGRVGGDRGGEREVCRRLGIGCQHRYSGGRWKEVPWQWESSWTCCRGPIKKHRKLWDGIVVETRTILQSSPLNYPCPIE